MPNFSELLAILLEAAHGMLEVADRDIHDLLLHQHPLGSINPDLLGPMLDRHFKQRSRLSGYQAYCAQWRRGCLTTDQEGILAKVEAHLVYLKTCNHQLIMLLVFLRSEAQNDPAPLKDRVEEQLH